MSTTTSSTEFTVPAELQPFYREPSGGDIAARAGNLKGGWDEARDQARQAALGWAARRKADRDRDEAAAVAAEAIKCQVCGLGRALRTVVNIPALHGLGGPDTHIVIAHNRCAGDLVDAAAARRRLTHTASLNALLDQLGIE